MSKRYNIIDRLKEKNQKPFISITEDLSFEINTSKTTALHMQAIEKDENLGDLEKIDKMIEVVLGKKALNEINKLDLTLEATTLIIETIAAALGGEELVEVQERFPEAEA